MNRILFFGYTGFADQMKASSLMNELTARGYECFLIDPSCYVLHVGEIVLAPDTKVCMNVNPGTLPEPFILFCGLSGDSFQEAVDICKGNIRAVLTQSNSEMTVYELAGHLSEERRLEQRVKPQP